MTRRGSYQTAQHTTFGDIITWKKARRGGERSLPKTGRPFIHISNLSPQEITSNDQRHLSRTLCRAQRRLCSRKAKSFSKDGTVGIAHHRRITSRCYQWRHLRLNVKDKKIDPDCLTACLNSLAVQMQVDDTAAVQSSAPQDRRRGKNTHPITQSNATKSYRGWCAHCTREAERGKSPYRPRQACGRGIYRKGRERRAQVIEIKLYVKTLEPRKRIAEITISAITLEAAMATIKPKTNAVRDGMPSKRPD